MIFLIHGPDAMMVQAHVANLVVKFDPDGANTTRLDGKSIAVAQAATMAGTPGFLGQARVILIDDLMARASKGTGSDGDDSAPAKRGRASGGLNLAPLFEAVAPDNVLILIDPTLASIPANIRKILPVDAEVLAGEPPRGNELINWIQRTAKAAGGSISPAVARELAELLFPQAWKAKPSNPRYDRPPDMELLRNEVEKLATAAHPGAIEARHLQALTEAGRVDRLFPFLEAAAAGQLPKAMAELRALLDAGEDVHRLSAQLAQQLELRAALDGAGGAEPVAVGRALGLTNPNRMVGVARSPRGGPSRRAVDDARAIDRAMKTGELRDPAEALYCLITHLAENALMSNTERRSS
jgi:DNA polymerase III delta subunit